MLSGNKIFLTLNSILSCEPGRFRYFSHDITTNGSISIVSGVLRHNLEDPEIASAFFHRDHWDMTQLHLLLTDGSYYRSRYLEINLNELNLRDLDNDAENFITELLGGAQPRDDQTPQAGLG